MTWALGIEGDGARGRPVSWRLRADWIPAYAGMTGRGEGRACGGRAGGDGSRLRGQGGKGVGSRFRGQGVAAWGAWGRGALRPVLALARRLDSRLRGNDEPTGRGYGSQTRTLKGLTATRNTDAPISATRRDRAAKKRVFSPVASRFIPTANCAIHRAYSRQNA